MPDFKKSMRTLSLGLGLLGPVSGFSQNVDTSVLSTKNKLTTVLSDHENSINELHMDRETKTIVSFMSGFPCITEMNTLLQKNGYSPLSDSAFLGSDFALFETVKYMNHKYGNPKIRIAPNPLLRDPVVFLKDTISSRDGRFSGNVIFLNMNLSPTVEQSDISLELLSIWIEELAHAKQYQRKIPFIFRSIKDYMLLSSHGYHQSMAYDMEGTLENEAHEIISPQITDEFIEHYVHTIDIHNTKDLENTTTLLSYFLYSKRSTEVRDEKLKFVLKRDEDLRGSEMIKSYTSMSEENKKILEHISATQKELDAIQKELDVWIQEEKQQDEKYQQILKNLF